jgi:hypothetical protein
MNLRIPGDGTFRLIDPLVGFKGKIATQVNRFPYSQNVFLMMKFREANRALADFIKETLERSGLRGVRADHPDWNITGNVYNPLAVIYCCKYGIALFDEAEKGQSYSPNVAYELGIMHIQGKNCLILRHASLPPTPFDLIKDLHAAYKKDLDVRAEVEKWTAQITAAKADNRLLGEMLLPPSSHSSHSEILPADEDLAASSFEWKAGEARGSYRKINWILWITNRGETAAGFRLHLVFKDHENFILHDLTESSAAPLKPGEHRELKSSVLLEEDLAERVKSIVVHLYPKHEVHPLPTLPRRKSQPSTG